MLFPGKTLSFVKRMIKTERKTYTATIAGKIRGYETKEKFNKSNLRGHCSEWRQPGNWH